ncbi:MAG: D-alanyl-D-alanine carboxypeptidase [Caldilineaceae bacterium]|nr:D-alanyl-D-alanine carboxypeptidase [Caldilineaceae bacterium]
MNAEIFRLIRTYCSLFVVALAALFTCGFGPPTLIDRDVAPTHRLTVGQLRQIERARTLPAEVTGRAVLLYDVDADQILMEHNADQSLPPASLTKLMTALLILEQGDLQSQVTIGPDDLIGGATMGLQIGERWRVEQLLWGLLVPSGNDAALALARHHSGQAHVFVQRMNLRAQELGLTATRFVNPHGLDDVGHVSSARDLLTLTRLLWPYPLFREIVGTASITVGGRPLQSTNQLLGTFPGANGVKTGTTPTAGQCFIASIDQNGHQLLIIVLGSQDRYADVRALNNVYTRNYGWRTASIGPRPTALDRLYDDNGDRWFLAAQGETPAFFLPRWELGRLHPFRTIYPLPRSPWSSGMVVGVIEWRVGDRVVGTQQLVLR